MVAQLVQLWLPPPNNRSSNPISSITEHFEIQKKIEIGKRGQEWLIDIIFFTASGTPQELILSPFLRWTNCDNPDVKLPIVGLTFTQSTCL